MPLTLRTPFSSHDRDAARAWIADSGTQGRPDAAPGALCHPDRAQFPSHAGRSRQARPAGRSRGPLLALPSGIRKAIVGKVDGTAGATRWWRQPNPAERFASCPPSPAPLGRRSASVVRFPCRPAAEITAAEVWADWQRIVEDYGPQLTVGDEERSGDSLTVTDVAVDYDFPTTPAASPQPYPRSRSRNWATARSRSGSRRSTPSPSPVSPKRAASRSFLRPSVETAGSSSPSPRATAAPRGTTISAPN